MVTEVGAAGHVASKVKKQRENRKWSWAIKLKAHSQWLLPPVRLHLPQLETKCSSTWTCGGHWGHFTFKSYSICQGLEWRRCWSLFYRPLLCNSWLWACDCSKTSHWCYLLHESTLSEDQTLGTMYVRDSWGWLLDKIKQKTLDASPKWLSP